ncbi:MAG: DUF4331 family protein, partial [Bacteroidetes bacterium]|nr:DUF4331 family protein [Bacteroidota bacterium]
EGKPFANNFLPVPGDMLRLNMAVPPTPRDDPDFSSLGLVQAAVLGLTDARFNGTSDLEMIPNMDGFPNGRRLEDDVTRISLQAVSGVVLAAIGLWYDDYDPNTSASPVTDDLLGVLNYTAGPTMNDLPIAATFPYLAPPHRGYDYVKQRVADPPTSTGTQSDALGLAVPDAFLLEQNYPNPFDGSTTVAYNVKNGGDVSLRVYDLTGREVATLVDEAQQPGTYQAEWDARGMASGTYFLTLSVDGRTTQTKKAIHVK